MSPNVRNMVINYSFTFISISTFILSIFIISRQCDMSRNSTSAISESLYYSELLCEACHRAEASQSFNIPSYSGSALFETRLEHLFGHHDL
jgi:hypothetical protein